MDGNWVYLKLGNQGDPAAVYTTHAIISGTIGELTINVDSVGEGRGALAEDTEPHGPCVPNGTCGC